jgi:hypothetical protein
VRRVAWLDRRYALLSVPRYAAFRDALLGLSQAAASVRVAEVSGNEVVTITGTAPLAWRAPPRSTVVTAYAVPTDPGWMRVVFAVNARDLLDVLSEKTRGRFVVDHIYDY